MTKTKLQVKIVNVETGEEIVRDANAEEIAQMKIDVTANEALKVEAQARASQRQEILDRLGLTAEEAALILG